MTTPPSAGKRGPGRPLPVADGEVLRRAHRLVSMVEVGSLLRAERAQRGLSQADMAARLGIGRQHLVALERGLEGASAGAVLRILAELGVVVLALPEAAMGDPHAALGLEPPPS